MTAPTISYLQWFARQLAQAGLRRAFGVPGGGTSLDLMSALHDQGIETVITAREDAAVIMAGVSGLLASGPGLAFTTRGPGLASALNGLASAALDRLPALVISEDFDAADLDYMSHQVLPQSSLVAPILSQGHGGELAASPAALEGWLATGGSTELPAPAVMFQRAADFSRQVPTENTTRAEAKHSTPDLDEARALLASARRPVFIVGLDAARTGLADDLRALIHKLAAPVLCTYMAKGCIADDDPLYAGIFTGGFIEQACVAAADLIVLVGLDPVELISKPWAYSAPVLDLCARHHEPHYLTPAARITGPLGITLTSLATDASPGAWHASEVIDLRTAFLANMAEPESDGISSTILVKAALESFPDHPRLAVDAGAHMFSACAFWPAFQPRDLLISNGLATMGFALPAGLAAALQDPDRGAIAMTGDGGLMMCLGELKTAVKTQANLTVIVFNDGRLSLIDIKRQDRQMPDQGLSWTPPDFAAMARGFGLQAWQVERREDLSAALQAAAKANGPRLIDVRVDGGGYGDQMRALRG